MIAGVIAGQLAGFWYYDEDAPLVPPLR